MITVEMEESDVLDLFIQRINYWTENPVIATLYADMYKRLIEGGCFDNARLNIAEIVDNDYVNNCMVISQTFPNDPDFDKCVRIYKERGLCDVSDEGLSYSYIESVDDEDAPTLMLVRV